MTDEKRVTATVYRAPWLAVFDGLRRVWCKDCRSSTWVPLLSNETRCKTCRAFHKGGVA